MANVSSALIAGVRSASRDMVRELGFMNRNLAGTGLPPSAVHALIEIGAAVSLPAKQLSELLLLEKSTISRLVKSLEAKGLVQETRSQTDGRVKPLSLTAKGEKVLAAITRYGELRVSGALGWLPEDPHQAIQNGREAYSAALTESRLSGGGEPATPTGQAVIEEGYAPGLIGRIAEMHGAYYRRLDGFDVAAFEAIVAAGAAEFMPRAGKPMNRVWNAVRDGQILGSLTIDGEDLSEEPGDKRAHLRWFVMDDQLRGTGMGKALLRTALEFCDAQGFTETRLWTFQGLDAARHLYETHGFTLADEYQGDQWGTKLTEQVFVRVKGG